MCKCIPLSQPPSPVYCVYVCVCLTNNKEKILSVVKSSHIGKVWYWEGIYYLLRNTNRRMQFWCWSVSVFPYLIPLPLYIYIYMCLCVFIKKKKEKRKRKKKEILSVVKLSHIGNVWYWEGVYHLLCDTNCRMQYWCWSWSVFPCLIPLPLYICAFECVYQTKKKRKERYSVLSSLPKSVRCDIEKGFITCSATLTTTCNFGVGI